MKQIDWLFKFTKKASIVSDFAMFQNFIYYKAFRIHRKPFSFLFLEIIFQWLFKYISLEFWYEENIIWGNNTALANTCCHAGQVKFRFGFLSNSLFLFFFFFF